LRQRKIALKKKNNNRCKYFKANSHL